MDCAFRIRFKGEIVAEFVKPKRELRKATTRFIEDEAVKIILKAEKEILKGEAIKGGFKALLEKL